MSKITAVILTKNEEKNIERCVDSVRWCDELIVVDDGSDDKTVSLAKKGGAKVFKRSLEGDFAAQRNFGLSRAKGEWVLFVDADEVVSGELRREIEEKVGTADNVGFLVRREDVMWGERLAAGEMGWVRLLRLGRKGKGKWARRVDEKWELVGEVGVLEAPLIHYPHQSVSEFLEEVNFKSSLNAKQFLEEGKRARWWEWGKLVVKFLGNWLWLSGYRDGTGGFLAAVMMSFHSFLVRGKLYLMEET